MGTKLLHWVIADVRLTKRVKLFLWELSHLSLNTHDWIQRWFPSVNLSLNCCIMCKRPQDLIPTFSALVLKQALSSNSVFHRLAGFWLSLMTFRPSSLLCSLFILSRGRRDPKAYLVQPFISTLWLKRNTHFPGKAQAFETYIPSTTSLYHGVNWPPFL